MSKPKKPKWVELLEDKFPKETTAADVIAGIFCFIPKEEFPSHTETMHRQIKEFSETTEYSHLFADNTFEKSQRPGHDLVMALAQVNLANNNHRQVVWPWQLVQE